jgi:hypothetical protein
MDRERFTVATPQNPGAVDRKPVIDFSSGYVQRALATMPSQADRPPWRVRQNYLRDLAAMTFGRLDEDLSFTRNDTGARA